MYIYIYSFSSHRFYHRPQIPCRVFVSRFANLADPTSIQAQEVIQTSAQEGHYKGGHDELPTQTMHFYKGNPSKLPYVCKFLIPPFCGSHYSTNPHKNDTFGGLNKNSRGNMLSLGN